MSSLRLLSSLPDRFGLQYREGAAADRQSQPVATPPHPGPLPEGEGNPLEKVVEWMREVETRMARNDGGPATQHQQGQIVAELDRLLAQAREAARQVPAAGSPQTAVRSPVGQPTTNPSSKPGTGGTPPGRHNPNAQHQPGDHHLEPGEVRGILRQVWGELLTHEREQMLPQPGEEFLPKYELLIEEYFRRLSEVKNKEGPR